MTNNDVPNVGKMDPSLKNSDVVASPPEGAEEPGSKSTIMCYFNGTEYSAGAMVCSGHVLLKCFSNGWGNVGKC